MILLIIRIRLSSKKRRLSQLLFPHALGNNLETTLSSDGIGPKKISGPLPIPVSDKVDTQHEAEFEKHDPDPCSRSLAVTTAEAHDLSAQYITHCGGDIKPLILDLEALVTSNSETCFPADSHTHLPE